MSPIGRIFIVLNLLLSAAFLGWAANAVATNQDYRDQFEAKETELAELKADLEAQLDGLRTDLDAERNAKSTYRGERDDLDAELGSVKGQLADESKEKSDLMGSLNALQETYNSMDGRVSQVLTDKDAAIEEARQFERERNEAQAAAREASLAQSEAEKQLETAQLEVDSLGEQLAEVQAQYDQTLTSLKSLAAATGSKWQDHVPTPFIEGRVLNVSVVDGDTLVALNVGSNDGVLRNMTFDIAGGGNYKGEIMVRDVDDNVCAGILTLSGPGGTPAQGDRASTRL